ncbi:hypothetical protein XU18_0331 [Perkinsela sp. CCAP 1560/4]|nr:hypothetical protein XU18_0331 [Perkinsela sp. CCAP 1560/4]|eukprot:KNH09646.1 hypothetical protein XU18_0331 [Perkinsela sp. CCAP 1560/4]
MLELNHKTVQKALVSWSQNLQWPKYKLQSCLPVTEGCLFAFNNTNFIRVALYFRTHIPVFRNINKGFAGVRGLWFRDEPFVGEIARFGAKGFDEGKKCLDEKLEVRKVVLENYVRGAQNILGFRWPTACILGVGHENKGSSEELLSNADVLYIPQNGVISSINLVSALAIALHVRHVSLSKLNGRALVEDSIQLKKSSDVDCESDRVPRNGDSRPIRPILYNKPAGEVEKYIEENTVKKLYVFYENYFDQKNLGGIIRNCNAFGVAKLFYHGRRKINRQGTVGAYKYLNIEYLSEAESVKVFSQYELWLLAPAPSFEPRKDSSENTVNRNLTNDEPITTPNAVRHVYLDDICSVKKALLQASKRGIILGIHQEAFPYSADLKVNAKVMLHICSENKDWTKNTHRGISPCTASAIALFYLSHILLGKL